MKHFYNTITDVKRLAVSFGGRVVSDGCGGWEAIAPDGHRWKDAEVVCYPLPLSEATSKTERFEIIETAGRLLSGGIEPLPKTEDVAPAPWRYAPEGDCDGEKIGTDHFVLDANGDELACAPNAATGRLMAASPKLLTFAKMFCEAYKGVALDASHKDEALLIELLGMAKEVIAEVNERPS